MSLGLAMNPLYSQAAISAPLYAAGELKTQIFTRMENPKLLDRYETILVINESRKGFQDDRYKIMARTNDPERVPYLTDGIPAGKIWRLGSMLVVGIDARQVPQYTSQTIAPWRRTVDILLIGGQMKDKDLLQKLVDITQARIVLYSHARKYALDGYMQGKTWLLDLGRKRYPYVRLDYDVPENPDQLKLSIHSAKRVLETKDMVLKRQERIKDFLRKHYSVHITQQIKKLATKSRQAAKVNEWIEDAVPNIVSEVADFLIYLDLHPALSSEAKLMQLGQIFHHLHLRLMGYPLRKNNPLSEDVAERWSYAYRAYNLYLKAWGVVLGEYPFDSPGPYRHES